MTTIATQLMQKWERTNPEDEVDVPADMTRLTLDTIGLCGFAYRYETARYHRHATWDRGARSVRVGQKWTC
jgi:cytochrome P450 / NADPH-cytochrome P450 reductase